MKKIVIVLLLLALFACNKNNVNINDEIVSKYPDAHIINIVEGEAFLDNKKINEYDYIWSIDINTGEENLEGTCPNITEEIYIAHDIIYYPLIDESRFIKERYDDEIEWVCYYDNNELKEYRFSTLPILGENIPTEMMHSKEEAYDNPVIHIRKAGTYILEGEWHGQILIDLINEDATKDPNSKVNIVLNGINVTCDVAPAIIFKNVYEVDNDWENRNEYTNIIDLSDAGAKVTIVDGTENNFTGANVYRLLKPEYKKDSKTVQKKLYKMDGAFYSFVSLLIEGEEKGTGILNINATTFEGLDSELHLTINSGYINIVSADDGINVNEDDVSIFTMNGGRLTIFASQGAEGDVIDSNGFIKVNGGTILGVSPSVSDDILDSAKGAEVSENANVINGGGEKNNMQGLFRPGFDDNNFDHNNTPPDIPNDFNPNNIPPEMPKEFDRK